MPGRSGESVVPTLQLQIRIADAAFDQPDEGKTFGPLRFRSLLQSDLALIKMNGDHCDTISIASRSAPGLTAWNYFFAFGGTIASLALLAIRNLTTFFAAILIVSPVAGFLPMRAFRSTLTSRPRPGTTNKPFFLTSLTAVSDRKVSICLALTLETSQASAIAFMI